MAIIYVLLCKMLWFVKGKTNLWIRLPLTVVLHHIVFVLFHKTNLDPFHVNPTVHVLLQKRNFFTPHLPSSLSIPYHYNKTYNRMGLVWSCLAATTPTGGATAATAATPPTTATTSPTPKAGACGFCLFILYILVGLSLSALYSRRAVPLYFIF